MELSNMKVDIEFENQEGFDKWFLETLAKCVAQGIVKRTVRNIREKNAGAEDAPEEIGEIKSDRKRPA